MEITVDISMYPLTSEPIPPIVAFIHELRRQPGIEVLTNQLSTQVQGEFTAVTDALNRCMREAMAMDDTVVFTVKYLNRRLDIATPPQLD
jgi:uncharacterized protein YqgV (UPF0045/DUF77 family)